MQGKRLVFIGHIDCTFTRFAYWIQFLPFYFYLFTLSTAFRLLPVA